MVAGLEDLLNAKLAQLRVLEQENTVLRQKERTLQTCIGSIAGGLAATRAVLRQDSSGCGGGGGEHSPSGDSQGTTSRDLPALQAATSGRAVWAGGGGSGAAKQPAALGALTLPADPTAEGGLLTFCEPRPSMLPTDDDQLQQQVEASGLRPARSRSAPAARSSFSSGSLSLGGDISQSALLAQMEATEQQVQQALGSMSSEGMYGQLYSTHLLRHAVANPGRVAAHLRMSRSYRLSLVASIVPKMGLLLPKYELAAATSTGSAREQLDALVDDLTERIIATALWDPPHRRLQNLMINLDTMQVEPYPQGWWCSVAQELQLSPEQKAALQTCWSKVKAALQALTARHKQLANVVADLQLQQQRQVHSFSEEADKLPQVEPALTAISQPQQPQQPEPQSLSAMQQLLLLQQQQDQQQQQWMQQQQDRLRQLRQQQQALLQQLAQQQECEQQQLQQLQQALPDDPIDGDAAELRLLLEQTLIDAQQHSQTQKQPTTDGTAAAAAAAAAAQPGAQQQKRLGQRLDSLDALMEDDQGAVAAFLGLEEGWGLDEYALVSAGTLAADAMAALAQDAAGQPPQQQQQQLGAGSATGRPQHHVTFEDEVKAAAATAGGGAGAGAACGEEAACVTDDDDTSMFQDAPIFGRNESTSSCHQRGSSGMGSFAERLQHLRTSFNANSAAIASAAGEARASASSQSFSFPALPDRALQLPQQSASFTCGVAAAAQGAAVAAAFGAAGSPAGEGPRSAHASFTGAGPAATGLQQQLQMANSFTAGSSQPQSWLQSIAPSPGTPPPGTVGTPLPQLQQPAPLSPPAAEGAGGQPAAAAAGDACGAGPAALPAPRPLVRTTTASLCHATVLAHADTQTQQELLLQVFSHEQGKLEQQLDKLTCQVKLQHSCTFMVLINILTKKQIAMLFIHSWPYIPDTLSLCEAFDELGWQ